MSSKQVKLLSPWYSSDIQFSNTSPLDARFFLAVSYNKYFFLNSKKV